MVNARGSVSSWNVRDRGFTPEETRAAEAVLERRLGGAARIELAFLGGSFAVGLGHGTSDIDLYAVGSGLPGSDIVFEHDGIQVHVNPVPAGKVRELVELGAEYRTTGADRTQIATELKTLNALVRLSTGQILHADRRWRELLDTLDPNVVRQILITRNANVFSAYAEDVYGALDVGDLLTAATASDLALQAGCEAVLAAAGDVYFGPKFLFRRLARTSATASWCDHVWRLTHRELHPESGGWPDEVRAIAEERLWAGGLLLSWSVVEGWHEPLDRLPAPSRPSGTGPRRSVYFAPLRFADGWAFVGPEDGYEVAERTVRLWRELDGRALSAVPREDLPDDVKDVGAAVASLAAFGAVEGGSAGGEEPDELIIRRSPRFGCHPKAAS
ncbi:hypothetical protein [Streptosporangium carneum]|uniref:Polymerase nucleotidyl transferase domain-containing protein n=1 Tax=Streptosporangium carneum TaxID=47481 RepID=A0A9W6I404_9ACTN|nr:hypothetical protein [Streptosporangium carneum]GLK10564.1 hypothetical protein GCM10017600_39700 [Streptosporangium carneum]